MLQLSLFCIHLDHLEARLSLAVHGGDSVLQYLPGDALTATRFAHQHRGVSGVFGLVKLDDFGRGKRGHLQTAVMQLRPYDLF